MAKEFKITSGFGNGIGSSVINGALDEIYLSKYKHLDEHLCLKPFPQGIVDPDKKKATWKRYREEILTDNGATIFLCGNKKDASGDKVIADGCLQEFEIAKRNNNIIIPLGVTGGASEIILSEVKADLSVYPYLEKYINILEKEQDVEKLVNAVVELLEETRKIR